MRRVVVVGASLAGLRAAEALRNDGFDGDLLVIGAESRPPYDRPPLSKGLLTGEVTTDAVVLRQRDDLGAHWLLGRRVRALDPDRRVLHVCDGTTITYDGVVVATGAVPRLLPNVPLGPDGVVALRTVEDALALRALLAGSPAVAIIGAGFIGTEVASTCRRLGLRVTLIDPLPVLHRGLGPLSGAAAARARDHGVRVVEGLGVDGVVRDERVRSVRLSDGSTIAADLIVVAVGARPETSWLKGSGAVLNDGVVCDDTMAVVGLEDVVAAGDVARWPHPALGGGLLRIEHWTNAAEQATSAARRLLRGTSAEPYAPVPSFWSDQFGTRLQAIGLPTLADEVIVVDGDPAGDHFIAEYRRRGTLVGAVVAGAPRALLPYRRELSSLLRSPLTV